MHNTVRYVENSPSFPRNTASEKFSRAVPKFARHSVTNLTLILSFSLVLTCSVSRFNTAETATEEKPVATPPITPTTITIVPAVSRDLIYSPLALVVRDVHHCAPLFRLSRVPPLTLSFPRNLSRFFSVAKRSTLVLRAVECC